MLRSVVVAVLAALALAAPAQSARQEVTLKMSDGVDIAATLNVPDRAAPAGGWPAVVLLHGLGGTRADAQAIATQMRLTDDYVTLTFDARGHGASGGLIGIDGPREVADTRAVYDWLAARPDVRDDRIGAWGISYGGGAIWNSLVAGTPWAAIEVAETWTDLYEALAPQGLAKSGVIGGFLGSLPPTRVAPEVFAVRDRAFAGGDLSSVRSFTAARSSLARLDGVRVPTFFMQGRRDFAFGLDQAKRAFAKLRGPKRLWIGNHGHAPSRFPAADTPAMLAAGRQWFDAHLRGVPGSTGAAVVVADEGRATTRSYAGLPPVAQNGWRRDVVRGRTATIRPAGKVTRTTPVRARQEIFGSPVVRVTATARAGWSRVVAVLSARTPAGKEIVVSGGGVPTRAGRRTYAIRLIDQATVIPKGSRLTITLGASSLVQNAGNLLYLDLPLPGAARLTVHDVSMTYPTRTR